jgi:hypothetical protein
MKTQDFSRAGTRKEDKSEIKQSRKTNLKKNETTDEHG